MTAPIDKVRDALEDAGCSPKRNTARCPSHEDRSPSLTFNEGDDGRALVYCHAGCRLDEILDALRLESKDLFMPADDVQPVKRKKVYRKTKVVDLLVDDQAPPVESEARTLLRLANDVDPEQVDRFQLMLGRATRATYRDLSGDIPPGVAGALWLRLLREAGPEGAHLLMAVDPEWAVWVSEHLLRYSDESVLAGDPLWREIVDWNSLVERPGPRWLVQGVLPEAGVAMLYGPSGSYKSFVALDLAIHVCLGRTWCGSAVQAPPEPHDLSPIHMFQEAEPHNRVLYVAGEGNLSHRAAAWNKLHHYPNIALGYFGILERAVNLLDPKSVWDLAEHVQNRHYALVVIDTLARSVAGADENASQDMGKAMEAVSGIVKASGASVLLVHHTGKDPTRGERGSSAIRGAVEASIEVVRTGDLRAYLKIKKQRDGEEGQPIPLRLQKVSWYDHIEERDCSSLVVVPGETVDALEAAGSEKFARAVSVARRHRDEHGELPKVRDLQDEAEVSYGTAQKVLKQLKEQEAQTPDIPTGGE